MNNVITLNKSIEDKRFTNAKGLQQIFIGLGRSTIDEWAKNGIITRHKQNKIRVNKQIYRGVTQTTKTSKERFIDIPETLRNVLIEHKQQGILSKYVFHHNGKPLHPWNMEETYFKPLLKRCNEILDEENQIKTLRFHDLRHSYATYLLSKGIPVKYVQKQLGHSKATMTLDTYADVMPSVKFGALDLLNKMKNNEQIEHKLNTKN